MAATYEIRGELVHIELAGEYSVENVEEILKAALDDAQYPSEARLLFDVSQSTSLAERSVKDLRHMAEFLAKLSPMFGDRIAIVAGNKLHYGMMRMGEVYSETSGLTAEVFFTAEDATKWLLP